MLAIEMRQKKSILQHAIVQTVLYTIFYSLRTLLFALRTLQQGCINDFKKQGSNTQSGD